MSGSEESSSKSATESQDDEESGSEDDDEESGSEDDGEEGGVAAAGGEEDNDVQLSEPFKLLSLSANIYEHSELIECWKKQESCCSIKIDNGKKYEEKNGKWLTDGKIDIEKVLCDLNTYINENKETSNAYDELGELVASLQKEDKIKEEDKRDMSSKIKTIDKEDTFPWGKREEKAYQELEKVIEKFKQHVSKLKLERFPLSMEILDELQKKVKQSSSKILEADMYTANKFPNVSEEESEIYSFEIDKDSSMVKVSIPSKYGKDEFKDVLKKHDRHIFIPSYMRENCAQLDWKKAIVDLKTLQILVVRPSQFEKYRKWHGGRIPIVSLPNNVIGIGYARHWILKIATYFGFRFIWMMDDSIKCFYGYDKNGKCVGRLRFEEVFSQIERFVEETKGLAAMSPAIFRPQTSPKKPPPAFLRKPPRAVVCLDLELINDKKVSYRPELKSFEDMLFGAECEREGLKVVMCNRIRASDLQFKHTGVHSPYQTGQDSNKTGGLKTGMN